MSFVTQVPVAVAMVFAMSMENACALDIMLVKTAQVA